MPKHKADRIKSDLKQRQNHIDEITALSNSIWYYDLSSKIHDINMNSWVSSECVDILKGKDKARHIRT